jgi:2-hydroxychromene-2-carboxylate isomerase
MPSKITLYIDLVSPFAYLAHHILHNSPLFTTTNLTITTIPIFLGGLMKSTGGITPMTVKNKDVWINTERLRWARLFSIPTIEHMPPGFPINMLKPDRALAYLHAKHTPQHLESATKAIFAEFWAGKEANVHVAQPDGEKGFLEVLKRVLPGEVWEDVRQNWNGEVAKGKLSANTKVAEEIGAFGLPWFECENEKGEKEGFWGVDHLGQVVRFMGLEGKDRDCGAQVLKALL